MNRKRVILVVLLVLLLVAGVALWWHWPVPAAVHLNLTGTAGLKVAGIILVDGVSQAFSGVLPINITVEARSFDYTIRMQEPRGELFGELTVVRGPSGSSGSANNFTGIRGRYSHTWRGRSVIVTTARKED